MEEHFLVSTFESEIIEDDIDKHGLTNETVYDIHELNINNSINNLDNNTMELAKFQIKVNNIMYGYILFVICLIGILGNMLVLFVLTRKALRSSTTVVTLRVMAIADTLVLVTSFFRYKTFKLFMSNSEDTYSVFHIDAYLETYVEPLFWISLGSSSFSTLLLSLERYLAVRFPLAIKKTCSVSLICMFIVTNIVIVTIITLPMFLSYKILHVAFQNINVAVAILTDFGKNQNYPCTFNHYIIPLVWYIMPWIVLTVVNILLSRQVQKSSRIRVDVSNVSNPNRNLSLLVILVVLVYMICNFPMCAIAFYQIFTTTSSACLHETRELTNPNLSKPYMIGTAVANVLIVLNSCLNICVYCIVGSKFRKELKKIFVCKCYKKQNTIHVNNMFHITIPRETIESSVSRN